MRQLGIDRARDRCQFVPRGTGHPSRPAAPYTHAWSLARRGGGGRGEQGSRRQRPAWPWPTCRRPIRREASTAELPCGGVGTGTEPCAVSATAGSARVAQNAPRRGGALGSEMWGRAVLPWGPRDKTPACRLPPAPWGPTTCSWKPLPSTCWNAGACFAASRLPCDALAIIYAC